MSARVSSGNGTTNVATGIPVLDHLLTLLARSGRFELALDLAPGDAEAEVAEAGRALGEGGHVTDPPRTAPGTGVAPSPSGVAESSRIGHLSQRTDLTEPAGPGRSVWCAPRC